MVAPRLLAGSGLGRARWCWGARARVRGRAVSVRAESPPALPLLSSPLSRRALHLAHALALSLSRARGFGSRTLTYAALEYVRAHAAMAPLQSTLKDVGLFLLSRPHYFTRAILLYRVVQYVDVEGERESLSAASHARCFTSPGSPR